MQFTDDLEKAELHVHLEGSIEPETLREIAPWLSLEEIQARYTCSTFGEFLKNFGWVAKHLREPRDYAIATRRLLERLEGEKVTYAEITLSAGVVLWKGQDAGAVHDAVREAAATSPVEAQWIWDAVRQWGVEEAMKVVELAAARVDDGVVAFGLGGDENHGAAREFAPVFADARKRGLRLVCHAGEALGADSVWQAIEAGAERIGHGIGAIEDPVLVRHLAERRIPLEVCPTSNFATGAAARYDEYPLRELVDAGVAVVLNTDDPAMFHCTLNGEYRRAGREFGLSEAQLRSLAGNSFRHAFRRETIKVC